MDKAVFEGCEYTVTYEGRLGRILETFAPDGGKLLILRQDCEPICLMKGIRDERETAPVLPMEELKRSGQDILGKALLREPLTLERVRGAMSDKLEGGYLALSYHTSGRIFTVDEDACVWMQPDFALDKNIRVISPGSFGALGMVKPFQSFLDGYIPILCNIHRSETQTMETLYMTEQGDAGFEYGLWIRRIVYDNQSGDVSEISYENRGACGLGYKYTLEQDVFVDCLFALIDYWREFEREQTAVNVPEKELERTFKGTLMTLDNLRNGFELRYGTEFYGLENHNNFPPNYISMLWVYALSGHGRIARGIAEHFLTNAVDTKGRIIYRQGARQLYGFSGSEIGQLLWLIERCHDLFGKVSWAEDQWPVLCKMGEQLCSTVQPSKEAEGAKLVHMCAEADTNGRIHDYLQNSLWAVRGLEALTALGERFHRDVTLFGETSALLRKSIDIVYEKMCVDTPFGKTVPFRLGYTATPLTLSRVVDTAYPVDEAYLEEYLLDKAISNPREDYDAEQDYRENNYANYRYYPEMLSSRLLKPEYEETICAMRDTIGGSFLGMTRLKDWLDDWPAYNNAVYFMERGEIKRFQLLFYAHVLFHGNRRFHLYYEQVRPLPDGIQKKADACLPSTALPAIMMMQMFCYETVDRSALELLKGIPDHWRENSSMGPVHICGGTVRIRVTKDAIEADLQGNSFPEVRLYLGDDNPKKYQGIRGVRSCTENYLVMEPKSFCIFLKRGDL